MISETPLQAYYRLLREAYWAAERVDSFDLRSDDRASVEEWNKRCEADEVARAALVEHVLTYSVALVETYESPRL